MIGNNITLVSYFILFITFICLIFFPFVFCFYIKQTFKEEERRLYKEFEDSCKFWDYIGKIYTEYYNEKNQNLH